MSYGMVGRLMSSLLRLSETKKSMVPLSDKPLVQSVLVYALALIEALPIGRLRGAPGLLKIVVKLGNAVPLFDLHPDERLMDSPDASVGFLKVTSKRALLYEFAILEKTKFP